MSQKIDPREVLTYLNDLGYANINAQQLKDFITDLKKLIKHEDRRRQKENESVTPLHSNHTNTLPIHKQSTLTEYSKNCCDHPYCPHNKADTSRDRYEQDDVFSHLYSQHTVASRAKEVVPRREKYISLHIARPKNKTKAHNQENVDEVDREEGDLVLVHNVETGSDGSKLYINTESTIKSIRPESKQSGASKPSTKKKSKCSFIRPSSAKSINKCDPVALYHFYQDQWKKQKFPGQENHLDLRWAVREKMLSGPKVDSRPTTASSRKRCNSWKG